MRLISPGANPPADVDRYLLPHEQEVITVRKHPAVLLAPVAWAVDYFVVTSHRFIETSGLFNRKVAMMPLAKVTDMTFQRSVLGRMLGYGTFILESAGQDQALSTVDHIPYPEQLYLEV